MKIKEIRSLTDEKLIERMDELAKELMKLNAQVATGSNPKSPGQLRKIKKTLAKIKTVQQEKKQ
ncbi:MAG: 50S ribosomal protein L29 [Nanoarchaeota archaeon]